MLLSILGLSAAYDLLDIYGPTEKFALMEININVKQLVDMLCEKINYPDEMIGGEFQLFFTENSFLLFFYRTIFNNFFIGGKLDSEIKRGLRD
jgi:hypothetical protein